MLSLIKRIIKNQEGQSLIILSIGLAVFLGFAAITVDYGYLAWQKRELQNAADAAALAAAWELPNDDVESEARTYANNHVEESFISATKIHNNRAVTVRVEKSYTRLFGQIFKFFDKGADDEDLIYALATAEKYLIPDLDLLPIVDINNYRDTKIKEEEDDLIFKEMQAMNKDQFVSYYKSKEKSKLEFFGKQGSVPGNFGILTLTKFIDKKRPSTDVEVIKNRLDYVVPLGKAYEGERIIYAGTGEVSNLNSPPDYDLSARFIKDDGKGYILAILPSVANTIKGSKPVPWDSYILLYLDQLRIDPNNSNKVLGRLIKVYDLVTEFPSISNSVGDVNIRLIK